MADIIFRRKGTNKNGSIPGEIEISGRTWPTIERGSGHTFVRKGEYNLLMDIKHTGRQVMCLRFDHEGIRTHLIHDALNDNHKFLERCIAPEKTSDDSGVKQSKEA